MSRSIRGRTIGRGLLGVFFIAAGANHFVFPEFYLMIMPPYLPWHVELVLVSGAFEVLGGLGVLVVPWSAPRLGRLAGWGLMALIVAVYPANIHMAMNPGLYPSIDPWLLYARLPLQFVMLGWVYWSTLTRRTGTD